MSGTEVPPPVALLYADDAYIETGEAGRESGGGPIGLIGRRVAGRAFLEAYIRSGRWSELIALAIGAASEESLIRLWDGWPAHDIAGRGLRIVPAREFSSAFFPHSPAAVLHAPGPISPNFAWARQQGGPAAYALCGVTHTLCTTRVMERLCSLLTAPFEPFDALICTSRAVEAVVREVTSSYADFLRERHGGSPALGVRLETIPLGVDVDRFRPATPEERAERRAAFGIREDEVAALWVGRFFYHGKAHPFPMYRGLAEAAVAAGRPVHLLLAGWGTNPEATEAFVAGALEFAPGVRTTVLDGNDPAVRSGIWHAADLLVSLVDNIQETFGLVVVEAMAAGLPVVATDWDGYRDLVVHGETGYLVATRMLRGATTGATARLLAAEVDYDGFLAECSQATAVDVGGAADALARLIGDPALRRRMGDAGRRRAVEHFAWPRIIRAYEELWAEQEVERAAHARAQSLSTRWTGDDGPACFPSPERSFACYPTRWLDGRGLLQVVEGAEAALETLLERPLTNYAEDRRTTDPAACRAALAAAIEPRSVADLERIVSDAGVPPGTARATLAWMLKYDLLWEVPVDEE
jgi:glycosyltransferase involved in cell wall biosynthesis